MVLMVGYTPWETVKYSQLLSITVRIETFPSDNDIIIMSPARYKELFDTKIWKIILISLTLASSQWTQARSLSMLVIYSLTNSLSQPLVENLNDVTLPE